MVRWLVIATLGCGGQRAPDPAAPSRVVTPTDAAAATAPKPLDQDLDRLAERVFALYQALAAALAEAGEDCTAAAVKLGELAARFEDVAVANRKVEKDGRGDALRAALGRFQPQMMETGGKIIQSPAVAHCSKEVGFTRAFARVVSGPE